MKDSAVSGYYLRSVDGEYVLVVRTHDAEVLYSVISRMAQMRHKEVKGLGKTLQEKFMKEIDNSE
jgi:hypothetical protein